MYNIFYIIKMFFVYWFSYFFRALYYYKFDVWYYNRKIVTYKKKLVELRTEKKKILDEVMEKETFKVAKEILEKYAPHQLQSMTSQNFVSKLIFNIACIHCAS